MNFWIVQTGEPLPIDPAGSRGMRAMNLARHLNERGHRVVLWSTDFSHQDKRHRFGRNEVVRVSERLEVRLITSCGYRRHIGANRFYDHAQLGRRFRPLAAKVAAPDLAFIGFPPIEIAAAAVRHCRSRGVPAIVDVKDLWPDLFEDAVPGFARPLARMCFLPWRRMAARALRECTGVCAPSQGFLSWARRLGARRESRADIVAPLTSSTEPVSAAARDQADAEWDGSGIRDDRRLRAAFVGTFGRGFDFGPVLEAARSAAGQSWQFVLAGDGDQLARWKSQAQGMPNVVFPGWIDRARVQSLLARSTVGLAPYFSIPNFEQNIANKIYDYLEHGLPIVSPLGGDVRSLLESERVGRSYGAGSWSGLAAALEPFADQARRDEMSGRARRLFAERFAPDRVYARLVDHLERVATEARGAPPLRLAPAADDPAADKLVERDRYERRAAEALAVGERAAGHGSSEIVPFNRAPYLAYEALISRKIEPGMRVLELAAGTGLHTRVLAETGARVVATDISPASLELLRRNLSAAGGSVETAVADMESLPFEAGSFDAVACAGGLSYGDPARVNAEIFRVLKPGGQLFVVDSLNHNPVYRLNRWIHHRRGRRSRSTLRRMPTLGRIGSLAGRFEEHEARFFGSASYVMPLVSLAVGAAAAAKLSDWIDGAVHARRSAFKFVLWARGFRAEQRGAGGRIG